MSKYLVIVDYNLTRFQDVKLMTEYAQEKYGAETILIRPNPQSYDDDVASIVFDLDPRDSNFLEKSLKLLVPYRDLIAAVLPFSDNAVAAGAALAEALNLKGDSSFLAKNAYSKISYRESESELKTYLNSQNIFVPRFARVSSRAEIEAFSRLCPNGFVLKPSCEGNNRGVIKLEYRGDLDAAFKEVEMYLSEGLICEELIPFSEEYSFDGIGHLNFITEKISVHGRYPVEKGQIVPARKSLNTIQAIERSGRAANLLVGQCIGPFHNEVKFDPYSFQSSVIEPNRRPAGMRIWHLAEKVYGVNFFKLWIDQLLGEGVLMTLPRPKGVAAIIELASPCDGELSRQVNDPNFAFELFNTLMMDSPPGVTWSNFRFTQKGGSFVYSEPKDNSGFIAEVCVFSDDPFSDIRQIISNFEIKFKSTIQKHVTSMMAEEL